MTEMLHEFPNPKISQVTVTEAQGSVPTLRCQLIVGGRPIAVHLVRPKQPQSANATVNDIANRIQRSWAILRIRRETTQDHVSYGLDFISDEPSENYSLYAKKCAVAPAA